MQKEQRLEVIKTYQENRSRPTRVTIGYAYRCVHCGVIWTRRKDALAHQQTCKGRTE